MNILSFFFQPPADPARFAPAETPPGWFGKEAIKSGQRPIFERVVLEREETNTWAFPDPSAFDGVKISPELTAADKAGLKRKGLNPENPAYAEAKKYFAANPGCSKKDLAAATVGHEFAAMKVETAKDVLAVFRAFAGYK